MSSPTLLETLAQNTAEDLLDALIEAQNEFMRRVIVRFFPPAIATELTAVSTPEEIKLAKELYADLKMERLEGLLANGKGMAQAFIASVPGQSEPLRFAEAEFEFLMEDGQERIEIRSGMLDRGGQPLWADNHPALRRFVIRLARLRLRNGRFLSEGSTN